MASQNHRTRSGGRHPEGMALPSGDLPARQKGASHTQKSTTYTSGFVTHGSQQNRTQQKKPPGRPSELRFCFSLALGRDNYHWAGWYSIYRKDIRAETQARTWGRLYKKDVRKPPEYPLAICLVRANEDISGNAWWTQLYPANLVRTRLFHPKRWIKMWASH